MYVKLNATLATANWRQFQISVLIIPDRCVARTVRAWVQGPESSCNKYTYQVEGCIRLLCPGGEDAYIIINTKNYWK